MVQLSATGSFGSVSVLDDMAGILYNIGRVNIDCGTGSATNRTLLAQRRPFRIAFPLPDNMDLRNATADALHIRFIGQAGSSARIANGQYGAAVFHRGKLSLASDGSPARRVFFFERPVEVPFMGGRDIPPSATVSLFGSSRQS